MANIPLRRQEVYYERLNFQTKPHLNAEERARMAELDAEWCRLMNCGHLEEGNE